MRYVFYCPIVLRRFFDVSPQELLNEYIEDWDNDEISKTADFEEIVRQDIDCLNDRIRSISDIPGKMSFQTEIFGDSLWLKVKVQTASSMIDDSIRDKTADVIADDLMDFRLHADSKDTILVEFAPFEAFNQTNCAAPYYKENQLLTEYEAITRFYSSLDTYTSPDFQCDQTGGFPTSLCVCWEKGKAWLELNENILMDRDEMELGYYRDLCADFGIRNCSDTEDFNNLLQELGEDAFQTAYLPNEDEDEGMVM